VMDLGGAVAAVPRLEPAAWADAFNEMFAGVAGEFVTAATRRRGRAYLLGLLSQAERKNSWSLAEFAGDASPDGMQRLLNFSSWSADAVRDALRRYVVARLGHPGSVLVADKTGFLKKGRMSAGVQRRQVGVFLAYASPAGDRALIDRELYLPRESWCQDRDRRQAGVPDDAVFATKPEPALPGGADVGIACG
jgi:SRSO17 transposase